MKLAKRRRRRAIVPIVLVTAVWCCLVTAPTIAHPFHITAAEAQFNQRVQSLEVSIELSPTELERAIELRLGMDIDLDSGDAESAIARYAEEVFVVNQAGQKAKFHWVGMELDIATGWLYFEFRGVKNFKNLTIENRFLAEVAEANDSLQLNTVRFSHSKPSSNASKKTLTFTAPDYRQQLDQSNSNLN